MAVFTPFERTYDRAIAVIEESGGRTFHPQALRPQTVSA